MSKINLSRGAVIVLATLLSVTKGMAMETNFVFTCENLRPWPGAQPVNCETRDFEIPYDGGNFKVTAGGAVRIRGWDRDTIAVRARIEIYSDDAQNISPSIVNVQITPNDLGVSGPQLEGNQWWQVSFELFVPQGISAALEVKNGLVNVADFKGSLDMNINTGAIEVRRCAGVIKGSTRNGLIQVESSSADSQNIDLRTGNGELEFNIANTYNGDFNLTQNWGSLQISQALIELPGLRIGTRDQKHFNASLGNPDSKNRIALSTNNGNVYAAVAAAPIVKQAVK